MNTAYGIGTAGRLDQGAQEHNPESLRNRLEQIQSNLARCEDMMTKIHMRLEPTPASPVDMSGVKQPEISTSHIVLEVGNSTSRLFALIESLANKLG